MFNTISNYAREQWFCLKLDYRQNSHTWRKGILYGSVTCFALTVLFKRVGLSVGVIAAGFTLAQRAKQIAQTNHSQITPYLKEKLPLAAVPTLRQTIVHDPRQLFSQLNHLQKIGRLKEELETTETAWWLSALHVAVLAQNRFAIDLLVENGAALTEQDKMGCTPIHLAVLTGNAPLVEHIEALARKRGVDYAAIKDSEGATVAHLKKICQPPKIASDQVVTHIQDEKGALRPITAAQWQELTKTRFCDYVQTTPERQFRKWVKHVDKLFPNNPKQEAQVTAFKNSPSKGYLIHTPAGLGVALNAPGRKNEILFCYGAKIIEDKINHEASSYRLRNMDCYENSNLASRINDGFPFARFTKKRGLGSSTEVAVELEYDLPKDFEITMNYGYKHSCKYGWYQLINVEIWKKFPWSKIIDFKLKALVSDHFSNEVQFIITTPKALLYLLTQGKITRSDLQKLEVIAVLYNDSTSKNWEQLKLFRRFLINIYFTLEKFNDPAFAELINSYLAYLDNKYRVITWMVQISIFGNLSCKQLREDYRLYKANEDALVKRLKQYNEHLTKLDRFVDLSQDFLNPKKSASVKDIYDNFIKTCDIPHQTLVHVACFPLGCDAGIKVREYLSTNFPEVDSEEED